MTPPPAPEPTTQTSASSVAEAPLTGSSGIVFGAASGAGGADSGPG